MLQMASVMVIMVGVYTNGDILKKIHLVMDVWYYGYI